MSKLTTLGYALIIFKSRSMYYIVILLYFTLFVNAYKKERYIIMFFKTIDTHYIINTTLNHLKSSQHEELTNTSFSLIFVSSFGYIFSLY